MPERLGIEEQIAKAVEYIRPQIARRKAAVLGPAPGARNVVGQQEIDMWDERDPSVDIMNEYATRVAQGMSEAKAQAEATMLAYPNRAQMMTAAAANDVGEQAKYAERMQRASEKRRTEAAEGATESNVPRSTY